jgi:hypothetical protein
LYRLVLNRNLLSEITFGNQETIFFGGIYMDNESKPVPISTMDLILEKLLANLQQHQEFDKELLKKISEIAKNGELKNISKVEKTIIEGSKK